MDLKVVLNTARREQCKETLLILLDRFLNPAFLAGHFFYALVIGR